MTTIKEWLLGKKIEGGCSVVITNTETGERYEGPPRHLKPGEVMTLWSTWPPQRQNSMLMRVLTGRSVSSKFDK